MEDRYIDKDAIAAIFASSTKAAEQQLALAGVKPINLGPGRRRGKRWLFSAVTAALQKIHEKAQPRPRLAKPHTRDAADFFEKPKKDIEKIVYGHSFTTRHIIQ